MDEIKAVYFVGAGGIGMSALSGKTDKQREIFISFLIIKRLEAMIVYVRI